MEPTYGIITIPDGNEDPRLLYRQNPETNKTEALLFADKANARKYIDIALRGETTTSPSDFFEPMSLTEEELDSYLLPLE